MKPILVFQTDFTYKEGAVSSMYGVVKSVDRELEIMDGTHLECQLPSVSEPSLLAGGNYLCFCSGSGGWHQQTSLCSENKGWTLCGEPG